MNLSDWFDYLFVYPALYAYWKATVKYLASHLSSLFWVVLGFITFTVAKGENTMSKSEFLDYAVAHPVALPFWIWAFLYLALPGLAWVQIESAAVEVDGDLEVLGVAEAAGHALDFLNLAIESLTHRVGHRVLVVGHDVGDVPANRLRRLPNGFQPAVRRPEVPPLPELPA